MTGKRWGGAPAAAGTPFHLPGWAKRSLAAVMSMVIATTMLVVGTGTAQAHPGHDEPQNDPYKVLVFSKTAAFRHTAGINAGIQAIKDLGVTHGYTVTATEDSAAFTAENLAQYKTLIFLSTTSADAAGLLNLDQQAALQQYIRAGGGWFGIHAASDAAYDWPWYGGLIGGNAYFKSHPAIQQATVVFEDKTHPMTKGSGDTLTLTDEWYDTRANPRNTVHVIASMDQRSYTGSTQGVDHPIAWCQNYDGGRSAYLGLGHDGTNWTNPAFLQMVQGGIETTAKVVDADCGASVPGGYEVVSLDDNTSNPMMLDVAPDGRVVYIERTGAVKVIDPTTNRTTVAATLPVFTSNESGLLGLALDPNFASNGYVYLFQSPQDASVDRLSRFTLGSDNLLVAGSEKVVLDVPVQRAECCHHGGSMVFDKKTGDLYLATGDNSNPFASDGYAPIDGGSGRAAWDARRTSGNTNSLSGKVLRIHPQGDGTYTVPAGNLFAPGTDKTKPEIYGMGFRNPFRINIDPSTGHLFVADYGPDASAASARGPENTVEWNIVAAPGNFGWPFCTGPNNAYARYDFTAKVVGEKYDCNAGPTNDSPNNTGLTALPPVHKADIYYHYNAGNDWAEVGGGGAPMAGPMYRYNDALNSDVKWPAYWDGKALFGEWNKNNLFSVTTDSAVQKPLKVTTLAEHSLGAGKRNIKMMDAKFGPDGALYLIDWGSGWENNGDAGIYRIDYITGGKSPVAKASADKTDGPAPLTVAFSSAGSADPEGENLTYSWDLGDGTTSTLPNPTHTYAAGSYEAQLTVTDPGGRTGVSNVTIVSGNSMPQVTIETPLNGGFFSFGDKVTYTAKVTDAEDGSTDDGTISCTLVKEQSLLGHVSGDDAHQHPMDETTGCTGTIQTLADGGHGGDVQLYYVIDIAYTDKGGAAGTPALTAHKQAVLQPKHYQAEHYSATGRLAGSTSTGTAGVQKETTSDAAGGTQNIGSIEPGDWVSYTPMNLTGITGLSIRAAAPAAGGAFQVRWNAPDGPLLGTVQVNSTGGFQAYQNFSTTLSNIPAESGTLYLVATSSTGATGAILNANWIDFAGKGMTENSAPVIGDAQVTPLTGSSPLKVTTSATATDPEGSAVTYEWSWGDTGSGVSGGASASHIYTAPGTYVATLTVRDTLGLTSTRQFTIQVAPQPACYGVLSDEFNGTSLDAARWTTVVRPNADLKVQDGSLVLPTSKTDLYQTTNTATNLVLQALPAGAWEVVTKVDVNLTASYQQAGILLYGSDDNYAKFVFEARGTTAAQRIFQYSHEQAGSVQEANSAQLAATFPTTAYLKLSSDGTNLSPAYSSDGVTWISPDQSWSGWDAIRKTQTSLGSGLKIGLASFSNNASVVTDAKFDFFHLLPDPSANCGPKDTTAPVTTGALGADRKVTVTATDADSGIDSIEYRIDDGPWLAYTAPVAAPDDAAHVVSYRATDKAGNTSAVGTVEVPAVVVCLPKLSDEFNGTSLDAARWTTVVRPNADLKVQDGSLVLPTSKTDLYQTTNTATNLVLQALPGGAWEVVTKVDVNLTASYQQAGILLYGSDDNYAKFVFEARGTTAAQRIFQFGHEQAGSMQEANSAQLAATFPTTAYLKLSSDGTNLSPAYSSDGVTWITPDATWSGWTAIRKTQTTLGSGLKIGVVSLSNNASVVTDAKFDFFHLTPDNADCGQTDTVAPVVTGTVGADRAVTVTATDEGSGVDTVEYRIDNGAWTGYTGPVAAPDAAAHTVSFRATDKAGNTSEVGSVQVPAAAAELNLTVVAGGRCVAGKGMPTITVTNNEQVPVAVVVTSPYSSKTFAAIAPGANGFHAFTTRLASVPAGEFTLRATATIDGQPVTVNLTSPFAAITCG